MQAKMFDALCSSEICNLEKPMNTRIEMREKFWGFVNS